MRSGVGSFAENPRDRRNLARSANASASWWLVTVRGANVPNWDLACEALYDGNRPALVLAEAKAHVREFTDGEGGNASQNAENGQRIKEAIEQAREGLSEHAQGVKICAGEWYRFSNRVAFAWKLASLLAFPLHLFILAFLATSRLATITFGTMIIGARR